MKQVGFLGLVLVVILLLGALAELTYLAPLRAEISRYDAGSTDLAALQERRLSLTGQLSSMPEVDVSQSDILAFASASAPESLLALQEVIRGAITTTGGTLLALQAEDTPADGGMTRMRVTLRGSFSETAMLSFLRQIEMYPTPIVVERLDVVQTVTAQAGASSLDVTVVAGALHRDAL